MFSNIAQDVCKSVRALGFSADRTHRIVDGVVSDIHHNGPEWVSARLKGLQAYYAGSGEFPGWVKKKYRVDGLLQPKGWMGSLVGSRTSLDTIVTVLSTVRGSIHYEEPTTKQLSKWYDSVASPPSPGSLPAFPPLQLGSLESLLTRKLSRLKAFGPDDIHGTRYPKGFESGIIRRGHGVDMQGLYHAWKDSISFAPTLAWSFQDQSGVRIPGMSMPQSRPILNALRKGAPDARRKAPGKKKGKASKRIEEYPVGHISFLQEPFGKLRTVANPNRFVQWQLTPLGEVLSDWVNSLPGIYNLHQEGGISWIQSELQKGIHLTSADLSSASDTLNYRVITGWLKSAGPEMKKHLEYFEQVSQMPWYISSPRARSFAGAETIKWKQGQPLGLRPSFPILTITNWVAASVAVIQIDDRFDMEDPPFAIVGDDIVIRSKYAREYQFNITELGGVANVDKACASSTQAEFCSRLITGNKVLRLKARYLPDNDPQNLMTYQGIIPSVRVPYWVKRAAQRVGSYSLVESGLIPDYHGSQPKDLRSKVLMNAVLSLVSRGKTTTIQKHLYSMWLSASEDADTGVLPRLPRVRRKPPVGLRRAPLQERLAKFREWNPGYDLESLPIRMGLSNRYYPNNWDSMMGECLRILEEDPRLKAEFRVHWIENPHPHHMRRVELGSAREQTVETHRTTFDHKQGERVWELSPNTTLSRLGRKVSSLERDLIVDESSIGVITNGQSGVEDLYEVVGGNVEITSYGPTSQSPTIKVPLDEVLPPPRSWVSPPQDSRGFWETALESKTSRSSKIHDNHHGI